MATFSSMIFQFVCISYIVNELTYIKNYERKEKGMQEGTNKCQGKTG